MVVKNTMHEYLRWRGDLSFDADPFNEVDNLILAQLSYVDFDGIVSEYGEDKISLTEVCDRYWELHTEEEIRMRESFVKLSPFLLKPMAATERFAGMKLSGYVNHVEKSSEGQMSAIRFQLDDGTTYVAFRGTDETIIGWKEDFNLSYMLRTEGQRLAVEYLNRHFRDTSLRLRVGGHSKGANFAVFASAFALPEVRAQIEAVYTNDGPGFLEEITETEEYKNVLFKTINIIPSVSIIGRLLNSSMKPIVVKSSGKGIMQHDALTWQVMGNRFVYAERSSDSLFVEKVMDEWMRNVSVESRRLFVDQLFEILMAGGNETMKDFKTSNLSELAESLTTYRSLPKDQQKEMSRVLLQLVRSGEKTLYEQLVNNGGLPEFIRKWAAKKTDAIEALESQNVQEAADALEALANRKEQEAEDGSFTGARLTDSDRESEIDDASETAAGNSEEELRQQMRREALERAMNEANG